MNILYQPENPQAILARCKIKPWDKSPKQAVFRGDKTTFDLFMDNEADASEFEIFAYEKLCFLPDNVFSRREAKSALERYYGEEISLNQVDSRMVTLTRKELLQTTKTGKFKSYSKTDLALKFCKRMKETGGLKCTSKTR
jgi:hypothetical protein